MDKSSITKIYRIASISLLMLPLLSSLFYTAACTTYEAAALPRLYVDPATYHATDLGETFQIAVKIKDVTSSMRIVGAEFRLQYNETLLETHEDWVVEGDFFKSAGETYSKTFINTDIEGKKYIHPFVLLLPSDIGVYSIFPEGEGTLATISFKTSYRPIEPSEASCLLKLYEVILVDSELNTITPIMKSGLYIVDSLPLPSLEVLPKKHTAIRNGETFEVRINIQNVDKDWHLVGLQLKLRFNTTLLETRSDWITEGDFFKTYGTTWFQAFVEDDYALIGIIILGETGTFQGPYPEGGGTVAVLRFKTTYQPSEPDTVSSWLVLDGTILVDVDSGTIPHYTSNGEYAIIPASTTVDPYRPIDLQVDVGNLHFNGEIADFYILVADYGELIDPESVDAALYFEGAEYADLTDQIVHLSQGLYRIPYTIPAEAEAGTYMLLVKAEYAHVSGTAIKSYLVSSTLANWDASISDIEDNIATVIVPSIGQIKLDLAAINATIVSIKDGVATIETSVGTLTTSVSNLDNDISALQTDLGTVEGKVSDVSGNVQTSIYLLYVVIALSLVAAILAAIAAFKTQKKTPTASRAAAE